MSLSSFVKRAVVALLALCFALQAQAGFDEGMAAFNRGDFTKAYEEWLPPAEKGDAQAQGWLGKLYQTGIGVEKNDEKALIWFRRSADQNNPIGQYGLSNLYSSGSGGLTQDYGQALYWAQKAAVQGYPNAIHFLGFFALPTAFLPNSPNVAKMFLSKAMNGFLPLARQGDIEAQAFVASLYGTNKQYEILDMDLDEAEVAAWLRNAAERGYPRAQTLLGSFHEAGEEKAGKLFAKDDALAAQWYEKAARQGDPAGQVALSALYQKGVGVAKDDAKAIELLRKAANQNYLVAQILLGMRYAEGNGVEKDRAEAIAWLRKAAARGAVLAERKLEQLEAENGDGSK